MSGFPSARKNREIQWALSQQLEWQLSARTRAGDTALGHCWFSCCPHFTQRNGNEKPFSSSASQNSRPFALGVGVQSTLAAHPRTDTKTPTVSPEQKGYTVSCPQTGCKGKHMETRGQHCWEEEQRRQPGSPSPLTPSISDTLKTSSIMVGGGHSQS